MLTIYEAQQLVVMRCSSSSTNLLTIYALVFIVITIAIRLFLHSLYIVKYTSTFNTRAKQCVTDLVLCSRITFDRHAEMGRNARP
jgi:hypothetical protein